MNKIGVVGRGHFPSKYGRIFNSKEYSMSSSYDRLMKYAAEIPISEAVKLRLLAHRERLIRQTQFLDIPELDALVKDLGELIKARRKELDDHHATEVRVDLVKEVDEAPFDLGTVSIDLD